MKDNIIVIIALFLTIILPLILMGLWIYAMVVYRNTPWTEVPIWVYWIMTSGRR